MLANIRALHVNHGLHENAGRWAAHCRKFCVDRRLQFEELLVDARAERHKSPEEVARDARYAALGDALVGGECLLVAHTAEDQAETYLLNLFRGAGPAGLAAMPAERSLGRGVLWRPLLKRSRRDLVDYLSRHHQSYVNDPANADPQFDRSYLRTELLPRLRARWPSIDRVLARDAALAAEVAEAMDEIGQCDLENMRCHGRQGLSVQSLVDLHRRNPARARNAVGLWLRKHDLGRPSYKRLQTIIDEVAMARADRSPRISVGRLDVRRFRGQLHLVESLPIGDSWSFRWQMETVLELPLGYLRAQSGLGAGISAAAIEGRTLTVCSRRGGERCRLVGRAGTRAVKKLLQSSGLPPWIREHIPLIYDGPRLVAVADLCVSADYAAIDEETSWQLSWCLKSGALVSAWDGLQSAVPHH